MRILAAYDLTGSLRATAELTGCSHHTVAKTRHRRRFKAQLARQRPHFNAQSKSHASLSASLLQGGDQFRQRGHSKIRCLEIARVGHGCAVDPGGGKTCAGRAMDVPGVDGD